MQDPKKSPFGHNRTTLSGYIFATKAHIDNWKKLVKQQYLPHISPQYGELRLLAAEIVSSLWALWLPSFRHFGASQLISTGFASWQHYCVTARYCSNGHQPNFAALNRGRHLYSAGWPSRWALAQILVY